MPAVSLASRRGTEDEVVAKSEIFQGKSVRPGEQKGLGTPYSSLPAPEGGLQESRRGTFYTDM